jgi:hypothetical protein
MITKKLCNKPEELIQHLLDKDISYQQIEDLIGVEFALQDGSFLSEMTPEQADDPAWYDQDYCEDDRFKITDPELMPTSFPVIVVSIIQDTFDRMGDVSFRFIEYVYPSDFEVANVV